MSSAIAKLTLKMMPLASVLGFGTSLYLIKEQLYYLSNAAPETPQWTLARVAKAEHRIEECLQRSKSEAGLADYEVRHWNGWHHHQTLALLATWFLVNETQRGKKFDPCHYAATDSRGHRPHPLSGQCLRLPGPHPTRTRNATRPQPTCTLVPLETT